MQPDTLAGITGQAGWVEPRKAAAYSSATAAGASKAYAENADTASATQTRRAGNRCVLPAWYLLASKVS